MSKDKTKRIEKRKKAIMTIKEKRALKKLKREQRDIKDISGIIRNA